MYKVLIYIDLLYMSNESTFTDGVHKIYKDTGFFTKYGGSTIVTLLTMFSFGLVFNYYWVQSKIKPIKQNWNEMKCHPGVIPLAGYINAPPGSSKFDYTLENFNGCLFNILSSIVGRFTSPVYFLTGNVNKLFQSLVNMVNAIRSIIDYIRTKVMAMIMQLLNRFLNSVVPLQIMMIRMKSLMGKVNGAMITALYTAIGQYYALKKFMSLFLMLIVIALAVLLGVVIILWIFFWTWPLAQIGTAAYILLAIPTIIITVWAAVIFDLFEEEIDANPF